MYRSNLFRIRKYSGFGTGKSANEFFKYLFGQGVREMEAGCHGPPTQLGYDSDNHLSKGEVGRAGVAIDSLLDFEEIFDGIPLDKVVMATTANAIRPDIPRMGTSIS